jgi:hypothetical protein
MFTMASIPHADVTGPTVRCSVTHRTASTVEFVDLLVADDDWVRREFDAIVAAGWGDAGSPPQAPRQAAHRPRRVGTHDRPTRVPRPSRLLDGDPSPAHQRSPPPG